jgi:hypothetical protein
LGQDLLLQDQPRPRVRNHSNTELRSSRWTSTKHYSRSCQRRHHMHQSSSLSGSLTSSLRAPSMRASKSSTSATASSLLPQARHSGRLAVCSSGCRSPRSRWTPNCYSTSSSYICTHLPVGKRSNATSLANAALNRGLFLAVSASDLERHRLHDNSAFALAPWAPLNFVSSCCIANVRLPWQTDGGTWNLCTRHGDLAPDHWGDIGLASERG